MQFLKRLRTFAPTMTSNLIGERHRQGRIEVVCGSMFSGKTEELIRRIKRATFARQRVVIFKPQIDTRYSEENVVSHDRNAVGSTPIATAGDIIAYMRSHSKGDDVFDFDVVGIDEAQFFGMELVEVCNTLADNGVRVIIAGLDMDFQCTPFGPIPALCAVADEVTKVHAICVKCGALAYVSHRLVHDQNQVLIGEQAEYEPLCRECYKKACGIR